MPTAPLSPMDQPGPAIKPADFLLAAADLHQTGQLASNNPAGKPVETNKRTRITKHIKVVR